MRRAVSRKKSTAKQPFLPFFVGDFLTATLEWEGEAVSLYCTLLLHQWAVGSIPADPKRICKLVRWDSDLFHEHWRTVRRKFHAITVENEDGEAETRLVNERLEDHRRKSVELANKNAESGRKGAAARWGKNGGAMAKGMANAIKRDDGSMANAINNDGERIANAIKNDGDPYGEQDGESMAIHPIPSHPIKDRLDTSSQDHACVVLSTTRARAQKSGPPSENPGDTRETAIELTDAEHGERWARVKAAYPEFAGRQNWIVAEHSARRIVQMGDATWDEIEAGVKRYAAYVEAGGASSPKYVLTPQQFFGGVDKPWSQPWTPPKTKAEQRRDQNVDASLEWLRQQEAKRREVR